MYTSHVFSRKFKKIIFSFLFLLSFSSFLGKSEASISSEEVSRENSQSPVSILNRSPSFVIPPLFHESEFCIKKTQYITLKKEYLKKLLVLKKEKYKELKVQLKEKIITREEYRQQKKEFLKYLKEVKKETKALLLHIKKTEKIKIEEQGIQFLQENFSFLSSLEEENFSGLHICK